MIKRIMNNESGYTLVETLVAMVIFLSVLIPVGFGIATYLFDRKAEDVREALLLAEDKMSTRRYRESGETVYGRFVVKNEIALSGTLVEYRVTVSRTGRPLVPLVVLSKMVQLPP
jgi:prepilin-type N-terminal cleavage/methylation domain-containing protein